MNANTNDNLTLSYEAPLEMAPEGRHPMLCVDVFETWPEEETWNDVTSTKKKIMFVFQVFPEDDSRDSNGDIYRVEHKINLSFTPASGSFSASGLWTLAEKWLGVELSTKSAKFNPKDMVGKAAWGSLEHKTRYVRIMAIEPYVDDDGKPLPIPKAEPYTRRTYPNPETWKNKKEAQANPAQASNNNPYDPIPNDPIPSGQDMKDALPF